MFSKKKIQKKNRKIEKQLAKKKLLEAEMDDEFFVPDDEEDEPENQAILANLEDEEEYYTPEDDEEEYYQPEDDDETESEDDNESEDDLYASDVNSPSSSDEESDGEFLNIDEPEEESEEEEASEEESLEPSSNINEAPECNEEKIDSSLAPSDDMTIEDMTEEEPAVNIIDRKESAVKEKKEVDEMDKEIEKNLVATVEHDTRVSTDTAPSRLEKMLNKHGKDFTDELSKTFESLISKDPNAASIIYMAATVAALKSYDGDVDKMAEELSIDDRDIAMAEYEFNSRYMSK